MHHFGPGRGARIGLGIDAWWASPLFRVKDRVGAAMCIGMGSVIAGFRPSHRLGPNQPGSAEAGWLKTGAGLGQAVPVGSGRHRLAGRADGEAPNTDLKN